MNRTHKLALLVAALVSTAVLADKPPKPGTFYKDSQLGIRKKEVKGSKIHITFSPQSDKFHWCPGVRVQHTPKATVVTFVRSKASQNGRVDQKAKFDRTMTMQSVVIETKNRETYIRNGAKQFKQISSPKQGKGSSTRTKNASAKKPSKKSKSNAPGAKPTSRRSNSQADKFKASRTDPTKQKMLLNEYASPKAD